jgi:hypothetical protein
MYGKPFLTNDRKPPASFVKALAAKFPDARAAWDNDRQRWVILHKAIGSYEDWAIVLIVQGEKNTFRELDKRTLDRLESMDTQKRDVVGEHQRNSERVFQENRRLRAYERREDGAPRLAHHLYKDLNIANPRVSVGVSGTKEW